MKNLIVILISFFTIQFTLFAQAPEILWSRTFGGSFGACVVETHDNGYVVAAPKDGDVRLIKVSSDGNLIWDKLYGEANFNDEGYFVQMTPDNGFILVGYTESYGAGQADVWLIKTDEFGDTLWTKTFGGYDSDIGRHVRVTKDGGFTISGWTNSYGLAGKDFWLIKTDSLGNEQWTSVFGGMGTDWSDFVFETSDSCYIIGGGSDSFCPSDWDTWIIKVDSNGDSLWSARYHEPANGYAWCGNETNGGFIFGGGDSQLHGSLAKLDYSGNFMWIRMVFWPQQSEHLNINCINKTFDDNLLLAYNRWVWGEWSGHIAKVDNEGNVFWEKELCYHTGDWAYICWVIQTSDSCYVASGAYGNELFIAKVAPSVTGLENLKDITTQTFSLSSNYPNPFNPLTKIKYSIPKSSNVTLKVFDILGNKIETLVNEEKSIGTYEVEFNGSQLPSGIYFYRLQAGSFVETKKMVLMK